MQIAEPEVDNWLPVLADLNLRLKALGEPIWQLTIIPPPPVDTGKRFALFRQKTVSNGLNTGRARTGLNERKNSGRMTAGSMCARIRKTVFYVPPARLCVRKGRSLLRIISLPWIRQNAAAAWAAAMSVSRKRLMSYRRQRKTAGRFIMLILMLIAAAATCPLWAGSGTNIMSGMSFPERKRLVIILLNSDN